MGELDRERWRRDWRKEHNGRKEGAKSEALSEFRTISILYSTFCLKK